MFDDDSGWIAYDIAKYNPYYEVGVDTSDMNYEILIALKESKVLANMLGVSKVSVSYWCNNQTNPSIDTLLNIAKVLEVKVSELINE
jgi:DNA-binding XRE family transcriptional regulator